MIAPSSVVPQIELEMGIERLEAAGFTVEVADQVRETWYLHAGTDKARAQAVYDAGRDPDVDIVWCARGGHGAVKLLPYLDEMAQKHGAPDPKLLIGYSDITILNHYTRKNWGWGTLHGNMPATLSFSSMSDAEFQTTVNWAKGQASDPVWKGKTFEYVSNPPAQPIRGEVVAGNLAVWNTLYGTPWQPESVKGKILFFEDIGELHYRLDAQATHLIQAGGFDGVAGIVLGDFTNCEDEAGYCLSERVHADELDLLLKEGLSALSEGRRKDLRPHVPQRDALEHMLVAPARDRGIPVMKGLPVGHGPNFAPLPLGAQFEMTPDGQFNLLSWDWLRS